MNLRDDLEIELGAIHGPSGKTVPIAVLRRSAQKVLGGFPDLLEPAVQDAVLRLHSLPEPGDVSNPVAYGAWVAHNTAINLRSKELRQRDIESDLKREGVRVIRYELGSFICYDLFKRFLAAVERAPLGERRRRVLMMTFQGFGAAEIAAELKVALRTVYNDLQAIKKLIETLDPTEPDPPNNGGGGKSGLPRGDPTAWLVENGAWRVAPLPILAIYRSKEVIKNERHDEQNGKGRRAAMVPNRRRGQDPGAATAGEPTALRNLRRLVLQLPAFRDVGLASAWADDDGDPPRNLEEVFSQLVDRGPKGHHK